MRPISSTILGLTGIVTFLNGASGLLSSSLAAKNMEVLGISEPAGHAIALGAASIGVFYIRAAQQNDKTIMWLTLAGRALAVLTFAKDGGAWVNVAVYEGVCGGLLAAALVWEQLRRDSGGNGLKTN